jgi:hypothetical protein
MNIQDLGIELFDIRDYFNHTFVREYKRLVIAARKQLNKQLKTFVSDGSPAPNPIFIKYMEDLLDKDYSYLYKDTKKTLKVDKSFSSHIKYDYNFVMDCFEYFDKNNIDELYTEKEIPWIQHLGLFTHGGIRWNMSEYSHFIETTDEINDKITPTLVDFPIIKFPGRHINVFPKKSFMSVHRDESSEGRLFTILNYPNIDRTMEDGSLYRYFIPKRYEEEYDCNHYDILCNYTTVLVLNQMTNNDVLSTVEHLITKNNSDKVRYGLYTQHREDFECNPQGDCWCKEEEYKLPIPNPGDNEMCYSPREIKKIIDEL